MTNVVVTETLPVNQIAVTSDQSVVSVVVQDATDIDSVAVTSSGEVVAVTISANSGGVTSLNGLTGVVTVQEAVDAASVLTVPGVLSAGQFSQGANNATGTFAVYAENPHFYGYNLTIGGLDSTDNRQGITFASSTPTGEAYLVYNDLTDKLEQSRDGTTFYPLPINTTELAEGTNLYYTQQRADARVAAGITGKLDIAGGTMTGDLVLNTNPTTNLGAATKQYVDSAVSNVELFSTDDLAEGATNLYHTTARVRSSLSSSGDISYNSSTGVISYTTPSTIASLSNHTTDNLAEGSTNLYYTNSRADARVALGIAAINYPVDSVNGKTNNVVLVSSDIAEGSGNLYFTNARARSAISVDDDGGDGSLEYNSSTGVITYNGPSASEVRSKFSGGTGVTYNSSTGIISIGQPVTTTSNVTFNNGTFNGNLTVNGTTTYINTTDLNIRDREITLNFNQTGTPTQNAGVIIERGDETNSALTWDETANAWYQNRAGTSTILPISTSELNEGTNLYYTTARSNSDFDSRLATKTTTNLAEGTNLYYTSARANSDFDTRLATKSTSDISEGTNLYYTDTRANSAFDTRLATKTTDNLGEGTTNLYYTDGRVETVLTQGKQADFSTLEVSSSLTTDVGAGVYLNSDNIFTGDTGTTGRQGFTVRSGSGAGYLVYNSTSGKLEISYDGTAWYPIPTSTTELNEGTNQYFTNTRARSAISVTDTGGDGSVSYDSGTGVITYTGPSASDVRAHFSAGTGVSLVDGQISIGQAVATTSNTVFRTVDTSHSVVAGDAPLNSDGSIATFQVLGADGTLGNSVSLLGFGTENVTAGYGAAIGIVDHGQNRASGTSTTGGAPLLSLSSTRGTAAAPTATGPGDVLGSLNFAGHDGVRNLGTATNGGSVQLVAVAGQTFLNSSGFTTQAGATTILRSQPPNMRLTSASRQGILTASYTGGSTNTPAIQTLAFNSTTMATQYDAAGNAINGHGRQDVSFFHPTINIFGVPSQSTGNADNSTLPGSNIINFFSSRQSGWSGRRDIIQSGDTLASIRVFGQTTDNSTGAGSQAGTIEFTAAELFSTSRRGSRLSISTGEIGTNNVSTRLTLADDLTLFSADRVQFRVPGGASTDGGFIMMKNGDLTGTTPYEKTTEMSVVQNTIDGSNSAQFEVKTQRYNGTSYSPTLSGDVIGRFTFLGNYASGSLPAQNNAAGNLGVRAVENWTSTASGTAIQLNVNRLGTNDNVSVFSGSSSLINISGDMTIIESSAGTDYMVIDNSKILNNRPHRSAVTTHTMARGGTYTPAAGVNNFIELELTAGTDPTYIDVDNLTVAGEGGHQAILIYNNSGSNIGNNDLVIRNNGTAINSTQDTIADGTRVIFTVYCVGNYASCEYMIAH